MIVVRVELWSAIDGRVTELARMHVTNDGAGTASIGNYDVVTLRGRSEAQLNRLAPQRQGRVEHYPRRDLHVWNLVGRALKALGYNSP